MPFEKGKSGNPGGRSTEKPFLNALRREMAKAAIGEDTAYHQLARKLMKAASNGEAWAIRELIDRLDGKAIQPTENHNINEHSFAVVGPEVTDDKWKEMLEEIRRTDAPVAAARTKHNGNGAKSGTH